MKFSYSYYTYFETKIGTSKNGSVFSQTVGRGILAVWRRCRLSRQRGGGAAALGWRRTAAGRLRGRVRPLPGPQPSGPRLYRNGKQHVHSSILVDTTPEI